MDISDGSITTTFISLIPEDIDGNEDVQKNVLSRIHPGQTDLPSCDCRKRDDFRSSGHARRPATTSRSRACRHRQLVPLRRPIFFPVSSWQYCALWWLLLGCLKWQGVSAIQLPDVYWNSSNPIFRIDNTDHVMDVNRLPGEYDRVNIFCPRVVKSMAGRTGDSSSTDSESAAGNGYYIIYNVSKEEYETCRVTSRTARRMLICDNPTSERLSYITITFRPFSPQPNGPEFHAGHDYYFISTSTGTEAGLDNRSGGRCLSHNMKLLFKVADQTRSDNADTDPTTANQAPPAQTTFKLAQQERLPVYETVVDTDRPSTLLPFFLRPRNTPFRPRIMKYSPKPVVQQIALNVIDTDNNDLPSSTNEDRSSDSGSLRQSVDDKRYAYRTTTTQDYFNLIREEDAAVNARQTKSRPAAAGATSGGVAGFRQCPLSVMWLLALTSLLLLLVTPRMLSSQR